MRPILERDFPHLEHAAALIGPGSEVLGFDDETSQDHDWGPRVFLFTRERGDATVIEQRLADELPTRAQYAQLRVLSDYVRERLGVDPLEGFTVADWLATPAQRLLELTSGEVFADSIGDLTRARRLLAWYPNDVWLYAMAGHWQRIAEYEHFVGRSGSRDDELGSRLITASLVRDLMRLALLQERRYPPYAKWLGTAYAELGRPERPALDRALAAADWRSREEALVEAYEAVAHRHNELAVTVHVGPRVRRFWGRPFRVLFADRFTRALQAAISDPALRRIDGALGAIDAVSDNTVLLERPAHWRKVTALYDRVRWTSTSQS